ncbi:hypothetical protein [Luteibacter yeojuensis]|uniref:Restriction endonuclease BglII n=1 Tax=Luteibacter yeojuensis TaxID=345309 RepID=A0A0F3KGE7_9GAMM|nr:hypothetical protein [Luteibacter yeojuensis]KJV30052.1 hypothetical protein VI08_15435 [Luteibacter yeojuensis]
MKFSKYSHCEGLERLQEDRKAEIELSIHKVAVPVEAKAATRIRNAVMSSLHGLGWSKAVPVSPNSDMTIVSSKSKVGLCLQTGNMSRMYADLIKLQTLYLNGAIESGVIILAGSAVAAQLGSNIASSERLRRELLIFRKSLHVPLAIYSLETEA